MTLTPPLVLNLTLTSLKFSSNRQTPPLTLNTVNYLLSFSHYNFMNLSITVKQKTTAANDG